MNCHISSMNRSIPSMQHYNVSKQREVVITQRNNVSMQRGNVSLQRNSVSTQRDNVSLQRDSVSMQRDNVSLQRDSVSTQRDSVSTQRNNVSLQRNNVSLQRRKPSKQQQNQSFMKKLLLTFATCIFTSYILFAQIGSWSAKANFGGTGRSNAVGFSIGSYGYIGTGYAGTNQKDFWRYDPVANSWSQMADFGGTARRAATGFAIGNFGYIGTGFDGAYKKDFWKYDVAGNSWAPIANFGGSGRYYAAGFSIADSGYVGTGMDGSVAYNDFWRYNSITDTWTARANFGGSTRGDCFAFAVSGKGYMGTGRNFAGTTFYNTFYQYNPATNTWAAKANFAGTAREGAGAFVIGNYGYAGTGSINTFSTQYTDFYKYDPVGNAWTAIATFIGTQRTNAAAFAVGNYGYLGTGYAGGSYTNTFYQYDLCGVTLTVTPTAPSCNAGSNGSVNLTVTGATNPLTYLWSNASTVEDATGLSAGGYTVTVTDGVGCTKTTTVTVTQPTALAGNITTVTNASCYSLCNGKITVTVSGATPPYTYSWAPSSGSTSAISNLCAGGYTVTITDSKGCSTIKDSVVTEPTALTVTVSSVPNSTGCICDGEVSVSASGGTPPYTYNWPLIPCPSDTCNLLCPGFYTVVVTDSKGCTYMDGATVNGPLPPIISLTATPATCPTCPNGDATANISGGTSPFTYLWNNGQTTQTATGLVPGTYPVCVSDSDSCVVCDSIYVGFAIGIHEISNQDIYISPNPSSGVFNVQMSRYENVQMKIYNVYGECIYQHICTSAHPQIDLSEVLNGIYFLQLKTEEGVLTKKIILNR
ncbi:MAG: T9SS type A sorting domain-containing protein [Bacteroidetes bacterium]|nr:T9SS type A sorting domain-containing protein [Bacteroidota bacterium]